MPRNPGGPTARILELARSAPGGVIRWHEAEDCYVQGSPAAMKERNAARSAPFRRGKIRRGWAYHPSLHFHSSVKRVLTRHFEKVEGTKGYYVLRSTIYNDDRDEDIEHMHAFHDYFGCDEFGMSTQLTVFVPPPANRRIPSRMSDIEA